jgi:hypothetical protein
MGGLFSRDSPEEKAAKKEAKRNELLHRRSLYNIQIAKINKQLAKIGGPSRKLLEVGAEHDLFTHRTEEDYDTLILALKDNYDMQDAGKEWEDAARNYLIAEEMLDLAEEGSLRVHGEATAEFAEAAEAALNRLRDQVRAARNNLEALNH